MDDSFVRRGHFEGGEEPAHIFQAELDPETLGLKKPAKCFPISRVPGLT